MHMCKYVHQLHYQYFEQQLSFYLLHKKQFYHLLQV